MLKCSTQLEQQERQIEEEIVLSHTLALAAEVREDDAPFGFG